MKDSNFPFSIGGIAFSLALAAGTGALAQFGWIDPLEDQVEVGRQHIANVQDELSEREQLLAQLEETTAKDLASANSDPNGGGIRSTPVADWLPELITDTFRQSGISVSGVRQVATREIAGLQDYEQCVWSLTLAIPARTADIRKMLETAAALERQERELRIDNLVCLPNPAAPGKFSADLGLSVIARKQSADR